MKKTLLCLLAATGMIISGCGGEDEAGRGDRNTNDNTLTQPMKYERNQTNQQNKQYTNKPESYTNMKSPTRNQKDADNGLANRLREKILEVEGVNNAEVVTRDDRILVALDIVERQQANPVVPNRVRDVIEQMTDNENISIYTDEAYFDRLRNLQTRP
ncbi:YhcN/YlaJ family sporulation lipoprotein [Salinibacillus xinjiangensis]|uniref:Sporulation protein n=1 Tax=Salinibacillus xinjiangensis TaxID=1229268 RepID=A0A6G1XBE6_9BACI|nr:YhcN/YlaJ family sporulation lipoprotein [Salinibacillus xinjiangensis]MRG88239.1 hypothetical protein [Salinibacillus xinjiangensis]